jgi:hypothetical protein
VGLITKFQNSITSIQLFFLCDGATRRPGFLSETGMGTGNGLLNTLYGESIPDIKSKQLIKIFIVIGGGDTAQTMLERQTVMVNQ